MNQDQRKFLIEQVTKTSNNEAEEIKAKMPTKPSLNNYLVAACLDHSIQLQDLDTLKSKIHAMVLKFGTGDVLVSEENDYSFDSRRRRKEAQQHVTLDANDLFVVPKAYKEALERYEQAKAEIDKKLKELNARRDTVIMKIQIGSSTALDKLVLQIDNMGDLNLVNTQLMLDK